MTPTETADQEEQERREEEARREEAAEDELRLTAQEDVAVAREAEALVEAYPTADLDLPGHLQHDTPEIGDGADGAEVDLPELASVPYTASRPSPLEAPVQAGLLDPGEDTSELLVAAEVGPPRHPLPNPSACSWPGRSGARGGVTTRRAHAPATRQGGRSQRRPAPAKGEDMKKGRVRQRHRVRRPSTRSWTGRCSRGTPCGRRRRRPGLAWPPRTAAARRRRWAASARRGTSAMPPSGPGRRVGAGARIAVRTTGLLCWT